MGLLKPKQIKRGMLVKDLTSGIEGIADREFHLLSGSVQFAVQPKSKDKTKMLDAYNVDIQSLAYLGKGIPSLPEEETNLSLGEEVEDVVSGYTGILVEKIVYLNGCVSFCMHSKVRKKARPYSVTAPEDEPISLTCSHVRYKKIGPGISKEAAKRVEAPVKERTGGPTRRVVHTPTERR